MANDNKTHPHRDYLYETMLRYLELIFKEGSPGFSITPFGVNVFMEYARETDLQTIADQHHTSVERVKMGILSVKNGMEHFVFDHKEAERRKEEAKKAQQERERKARLEKQEQLLSVVKEKKAQKQREAEEKEEEQRRLAQVQETERSKVMAEADFEFDEPEKKTKRKAFTPKGIVDTHGRYKDMNSHGIKIHSTLNLTNHTGIDINEGRKTFVNGRLVSIDDNDMDDWRDRD